MPPSPGNIIFHTTGCFCSRPREETISQDSNSDTIAKTPLPKSVATASSLLTASWATKEEDISNFTGGKSSPALSEAGLKPITRGGLPSQPSPTIVLSAGSTISNNGALDTMPLSSEIGKLNILVIDDRSASTGMTQSIASPLSNRVILPQASKASGGPGASDVGNAGDSAIMGRRVFTSPVVPGVQWRPGGSFQNQNEMGQFCGQIEIAPDQRKRFLQRFQQVQQQGQTNILGMTSLTGGRQYSASSKICS